MRGFIRKYWVLASRSKKNTIAVILELVAAILVFPVHYRVPASCEVQPYFLQQVAAPFDGVLEKTFVRPGDQVEKGQLLARLDGREIGWRLSQAVAQREIALKKRNQALFDAVDQDSLHLWHILGHPRHDVASAAFVEPF